MLKRRSINAKKFLATAMLLVVLASCAVAQTWTQTSAPSNAWHCIAASADASKLAAGIHQILGSPAPGLIYLSSDSGTNWTPANIGSNLWSSLALSADGSKLFAVADSGNSNRIYSSTNFGATWSTNILSNSFPSSGNPPQIACSADGSKLITSYHGTIWTSTNSGNLWASNTLPIQMWESPSWYSVACSADGNKMLIIKLPEHLNVGDPYAPNIFISTNAGATWLKYTNVPYLGRLATSADGNTFAVAMGSGANPKVFTSIDAGTSWTTNTLPLYSAGIALSADGTTMLSAGAGGWIASSTNSGALWTTNNNFAINMQWDTGTMSADGTKWFLTSQPGNNPNAGHIYTRQTTPAPALNVTPNGGNLSLSWIIPSANFILQQSPDLAAWADVTNQPVFNPTSLQNQITLPVSAGNVFFRLKAH